MKLHTESGGTLSASAYITLGIGVDKMRAELINLSPRLFTTSDALDFREKEPPVPPGTLVDEGLDLSDTRVPREIDHLMKTVLKLWGRYGEAAGISPLIGFTCVFLSRLVDFVPTGTICPFVSC